MGSVRISIVSFAHAISMTGKVEELRAELNSDKKDPKFTKKRSVLKRIVANMTMGNDMASLFPDVLACMQLPSLEIKKMVYLYIINYAKSAPELVIMAVNSFIKVREWRGRSYGRSWIGAVANIFFTGLVRSEPFDQGAGHSDDGIH